MYVKGRLVQQRTINDDYIEQAGHGEGRKQDQMKERNGVGCRDRGGGGGGKLWVLREDLS